MDRAVGVAEPPVLLCRGKVQRLQLRDVAPRLAVGRGQRVRALRRVVKRTSTTPPSSSPGRGCSGGTPSPGRRPHPSGATASCSQASARSRRRLRRRTPRGPGQRRDPVGALKLAGRVRQGVLLDRRGVRRAGRRRDPDREVRQHVRRLAAGGDRAVDDVEACGEVANGQVALWPARRQCVTEPSGRVTVRSSR